MFVPRDKSDSDQTVHNLQLTSAWIRRYNNRADYYILLLLYTVNSEFFTRTLFSQNFAYALHLHATHCYWLNCQKLPHHPMKILVNF